MDDAITEERRSQRLQMAMPARCRTLGGFIDDLVIRDLSAHGCRVFSHALTLRPKGKVVVRPQGIEGLCGTVRWVRGHEAGIEFDQPLYQPVVEHLHQRFAGFLPPQAERAGQAPRSPRRLAA